jgi:hypothetical protein
MSHNFLFNANFHKTLLEIDQITASECQQKGCGFCGGKLHQAQYPRIGFGVSSKIAPLYARRLSFCCAVCRTRTTPSSIRFMGRRRYVSSAFVLLCVLRLSPCEKRCEQLARRFGLHISVSTWKRWRTWWRQHFPHTQFWTVAKARVSLMINEDPLPRALLSQFAGAHLSQRLILLLRFLAPLTTGAV